MTSSWMLYEDQSKCQRAAGEPIKINRSPAEKPDKSKFQAEEPRLDSVPPIFPERTQRSSADSLSQKKKTLRR